MASERRTVVFVHAHPDDEAIFTGGTMRLLADAGYRVVLVCATDGAAGALGDGEAPSMLGRRRCAETLESADLLGIDTTYFLGYGDSGADAELLDGFAHVDIDAAIAHCGQMLDELGEVDAVVIYDEDGTYGHPDHIQAHRVGLGFAAARGVDCVYEATVDREYLHFVETHLVVEAGLGERPESLGLAATNLGRPTVLIDLDLDVAEALDAKRQAMAAHASQLPGDAPVFELGEENFAAVYGHEWYVRRGPRGALDDLA